MVQVGKSWWKVGKAGSTRNGGISTFWDQKITFENLIKLIEIHTIV